MRKRAGRGEEAFTLPTFSTFTTPLFLRCCVVALRSCAFFYSYFFLLFVALRIATPCCGDALTRMSSFGFLHLSPGSNRTKHTQHTHAQEGRKNGVGQLKQRATCEHPSAFTRRGSSGSDDDNASYQGEIKEERKKSQQTTANKLKKGRGKNPFAIGSHASQPPPFPIPSPPPTHTKRFKDLSLRLGIARFFSLLILSCFLPFGVFFVLFHPFFVPCFFFFFILFSLLLSFSSDRRLIGFATTKRKRHHPNSETIANTTAPFLSTPPPQLPSTPHTLPHSPPHP